MHSMIKIGVASAAVLAVLTAGGPALAVGAGTAATLSASATPKVVRVDPSTGAVVSVTRLSEGASTQAVTVHNPCASGDACWQPDSTPYAQYGFGGTGTATGTWAHRRVMYTRSHSTSICWTYQGSSPCSQRFGANTVIDPGASVTGKKVTNYT